MLSCADAEQMELCPDEMRRKKASLPEPKPMHQSISHLKRRKKEEKRKGERERKPCKLQRKEVLESSNVGRRINCS